MFFFFPFNTDAPLYHPPRATIGLIVVNLITFILTGGGLATENWILTFGEGFHPLEWISSNFVHFGFAHLIGNMIFLWSYGLVIEGKLGSLRFLGLYFALCVLDGFLAQLFMFWAVDHPGALGASGVIFALMAMALLWAPKNNFMLAYLYWLLLWVRFGVWEVAIQWFSLFYLITNLIGAWLIDFEMSTPVLHLIGAVIGFPVGYLFLRQGWVDCENWDLFSVWQGKHLTPDGSPLVRKALKSTPEIEEKQVPQLSPRELAAKAEKLIERRQFEAAFRAYRKCRESGRAARKIEMSAIKTLAEGLHRLQLWKETAFVLDDYVHRGPHDETRARLVLAGILSKEERRPKKALGILDAIDDATLNAANRDLREKIRRNCEAQISNGVLEILSD